MRDRVVIVDILTKKFKSVFYKQYDDNNKLNIVVYEGKTLADISNYVASVCFELPSGKVYEVDGTIENNTIKVILSSSILKEYGQVNVECELSNLDEVVTTFTFYLNVEKSIKRVDTSNPNVQPPQQTYHTHSNLDVLNQITQEMIDSIDSSGGLVDLSIYQTKRDTTLETNNKTISGAINEINEKVENSSVNIDLSDYALKSEIPTVPTKVSQLTNDSNFAVQPNFTFAINMIASTEQPSVTTTGVYPNLVITFNIPQGTTSSGGDDPVVAEKAIYYGRLSIAEVGGRIVQYSEITDIMIKNGVNITKITPQTLGKTSLGKESTTAEGDYVVVAVPKNEGYVVTQDNGFGGKVIFNKEEAGANGDYTVVIDGNEYALYGQILISPAEIFIYIDKN